MALPPPSSEVGEAKSGAADSDARFSALAPRNISFAATEGSRRIESATRVASGKPAARTPMSRPPGPNAGDLTLESLGLPGSVAGYFRETKRIERLYPWQAECLSLDGVFDHRENLVYCAPTSGGKSLVSDVLLVRRLLSRPGSLGIVVLPFVSLCQERADELHAALKSTGIEIRRFYGGRGGKLPPPDGLGGLLVCTPEKANDLVTRLVEEERVGELSAIVVDELHMVQDPSRGGTLELMLTKLMFAVAKLRAAHEGARGEHSQASGDESGSGGATHDHLVPLTGVSGSSQADAFSPPQIVGMSATLPNVDGLARWLGNARLYETTFRPVPLSVFVKNGAALYELPTPEERSRGAPLLDDARRRNLREGADADHVAELVRETISRGPNAGGVIVFCSARFQCETHAVALAGALDVPEAAQGASALGDVVDELRRVGSGSGGARETEKKPSLATCASRGVAWHHAGMHAEEKSIVERGFREGLFRVVCCTTTMATGVNLPASRVIIPSAYYFRKKPALHELMRARDLQQMVGRAGRAGFADRGEAFVVCPKPTDVSWGWRPGGARGDADALTSEIASRLSSDGEALSSTIAAAGMRRVMLEGVACGLARGPEDIKRYVQCTLLNALNDFQDVVAKDGAKALAWLRGENFLRWDADAHRWDPAPLGRAAAAAHLDPARAVGVIKDILRARQCLILESDLHLLFLCVPPDPPAAVDAAGPEKTERATPSPATLTAAPTASASGRPASDDECWLNAKVFLSIYDRLSAHERNVAGAVGITDAYVHRLECGRKDATPEHRAARRVCVRFLKALQLHDVVSERDPNEIMAAFGVAGGHLAQLQEAASRYAGQVAAVCGPMGWGDVEVLVTRLQDRISAGARDEILCLTQIPGIGAARARALYDAGYRTPESLVGVEPQALATLLETRSRGRAKMGEMRAATMIVRGAKALCAEQRRGAREESEAKLRELKKLAPISPDATDEGNDDGSGDDAFDLASARGTVVVREPRHLEALERRWRAEPEYAFVLQPGTSASRRGAATGIRGQKAAPPSGIALVFPSIPRATFYARVLVAGSNSGADVVARGFAWETVRSILAEPGPKKITVDLKPQLLAAGAADGVLVGRVAPPFVDVRVAGWLLRPDSPDLACAVGAGWVGAAEGGTGADAALRRAFAGEFDDESAREASEWKLGRASSRLHAAAAATARVAAVCAAAWSALRPRLADAAEEERRRDPEGKGDALESAARDAEMPLVPVLAEMEAVGMPFAPEALRRQLRRANRRLVEIEALAAKIVSDAGAAPASLTSSADVERVLFEDLKLPPPPCAVVLNGGGRRRRFKTNADVLKALAGQHPLPKLLHEHRQLHKCVTIAEELVEAAGDAGDDRSGAAADAARALRGADADASDDESDGSDESDESSFAVVRLRGAIHQTNTGTGRLAMEEPNLQTVPRARDFVLATRATETLAIRRAFRAPPGRVLVSADYRQLELRVLAHLSNDPGLVAAFNARPDEDPFRVLAARWLGARGDASVVSEEERARAKALAYGVVYGSGPARFAAEAGVSEAEARDAQETFRRSLPGVEAWREATIREAARRNPPRVRTLAGRFRALPALAPDADRALDRGADERKAVNAACQGSAADVVKRAMLEAHARLSEARSLDAPGDDDEDPVWARLRAGKCRMVLQMHDELVFEVDEADAADAVRAIRPMMARAGEAFGLRVPTPARVCVGPDWGSLEEVFY